MLQEIRESLRHLHKPSGDVGSTDQNMMKLSTEDSRQQGRNALKFVTHQKALQEIRNSLLPFSNEYSSSVRGSADVNKQMLQDLVTAGFDEVRDI